MKNYLIVLLLLSAISCKQDASIVPNSQSESNRLPALSKDFNINTASKTEIMSILTYLDSASVINKNSLYERLFGPIVQATAQRKVNINSKANDNAADEYTPEQIVGSMQPLVNGNYWDEQGSSETLNGGMWGLTLFYKWTVLTSPIAPFIVQSTEKVDLADEGNPTNVEQRYAIQTVTHSGSAIVGIAPFISWNETGNIVYWQIYTAYSTVDGILSGMSMHSAKQSTRIFNAGAVIQSWGQRAKL